MLKRFLSLTLLLPLLLVYDGWGQVQVNAGTIVTENFTGFTGSGTPTNWAIRGTGSRGTTWNGTDQTAGTSGGWYGNANMSFLGSSSASNGNATWILQNKTGETISNFKISFVARLWKSGTASPTVTVSWSKNSSASDPIQGALANALSSLSFSDATASISTGATLTQNVTGASVANNEYIFIRFIHAGGGSSDNLGWDDITFSPEPSSASSVTFESIQATQMTINWTNGNGANRLVLVKSGSSVDGTPSDGTSYTGNAAFGSGTQIGSGNYAVYNGNSNTVTITNLTANTVYHVAVYEYNGTGSSINYISTTTATASRTTLPTEPTSDATDPVFSVVTENGFKLSWTNGNGAERLVLVKSGSSVDAAPTDGNAYTADAAFGSGSQIGTGNFAVYKGNGSSVDVTGLAHSTTYHIAVFEYNGNGTLVNYKTDSPLRGSQATSVPTNPIIDVSSTSLNSFGTFVIGNSSSEQSFTVSGSNMNGSVSVTAPSGFQVSLTTGGPYTTDPLEVSSERNFGPVDIFVIFQPASAGVYSANISISGGGASSKTVAVAGKGIETQPPTQASDAIVTSASASLSLNWTNGDGTGRIVLMKQGTAVDATPVDGTSYTANTAFSTGTQIGTGNYVVYAGNGAKPVTVTGLTPGLTYHIAIFEFNGSGGTENYLTTDPARANGATLTLSMGTVTPATFCVDASNAASGTIAYTVTGVYSASNTFTAYLSNASGIFESDQSIGSLANTTGGGTINISIPAGTVAGSGYKIRIKSSHPEVIVSDGSTAFTVVFGISNVTSQSSSVGNQRSILSWTNPTNCFDEIMIVAKAGSAVTASPTGDGSAYTADLNFGSGTPFDGGYVVYKGSAAPQTVTGLTNGIAYHYKFFTRRGSSWSEGIQANATPVYQLEPGDIAFLAMQTDDTDQFAFVTLADLPASQVIYFTDNAWTGTALNTNEGTLIWTGPNSTVDKGTVITILGTNTASLGTVSSSAGSFSLATSGDQILAYIGTSGSPIFISGISSTGWLSSGSVGNSTSYLPTPLIQNSTALGFSPEMDNQYFTSASNQGSRNSFLASINNSANWSRSDTRYSTLPNWTFTFSNTATTPSVPSGSNVSVSTGGTTGISNITFTTVTTGGTVTVDRFNNEPSGHGLTGNVSNYRFIITPDNSLVYTIASGYTLRFDLANIANHGIAELANGDNTSVKLYKRSTPGSGSSGNSIALTYYRNGTDGNQADDYLVSDLITNGFSEFYFQSESQPLPVELTSFTAKASGTTVTLNWETKTEVDNNGFEVERNANGTWQKIGFVEGHGTANSPKYYSFSDANPLGSKIQYRLKQIDNDGSFEYSPVVEVELAPVNYTLYQNYPNPFNPSTVIRYALPVAGMVTIDVFNALGEKVSTLLNGQVEAGFNQVSFDATNLPSGLYFYRIQSGDFTSIKKMLLMK